MSSLLTVGCHTRSRVYGEMVSQTLPIYFSVGCVFSFFPILLMGKCCSGLLEVFFAFFAEEIFPHVAVILVWEKMTSGSFYVTIVNHSSHTNFENQGMRKLRL